MPSSQVPPRPRAARAGAVSPPQRPGEDPQTPSELPNSSWIKRLFILVQKMFWGATPGLLMLMFPRTPSNTPNCKAADVGPSPRSLPKVFLILKNLLLMDKSSYIFMGCTAVFYGTFKPVKLATVFCGENMQNREHFAVSSLLFAMVTARCGSLRNPFLRGFGQHVPVPTPPPASGGRHSTLYSCESGGLGLLQRWSFCVWLIWLNVAPSCSLHGAGWPGRVHF